MHLFYKSAYYIYNLVKLITGSENIDEINFIPFLKTNNIYLHEDLDIKILTKIRSKVNNGNVATYYQIASCFSLKKLRTKACCYIKRLFTLVCETLNFLELDYTQVAQIISSSELRIDSELEVLDAADNWVKYDYLNRKKYAKDLLLKIRLSMLSNNILNRIGKMNITFNKIDDCVVTLKDISQNIKNVYENKSSNFYSKRFCSQNSFDIIVSGGYTYGSNDEPIFFKTVQRHFQNLSEVKELPSILSRRYDHKSIYCRGDIYVVGGSENYSLLNSIEKYSLVTNKWEQVGNIPDLRKHFCACAFMDQILLFGGEGTSSYSDSCKQFDTKRNDLKEIKKMCETRSLAASAIFEGRVVVLGGCNNAGSLNTVEEYTSDTWSSMPNMIERRQGHSSVAVKNKLYVIGNYFHNLKAVCEVFDSVFNKFVALKNIPKKFVDSQFDSTETFSIGRKLIIIKSNSRAALIYDELKDEWSKEKFLDKKCLITVVLLFRKCSFNSIYNFLNVLFWY